MRSPFSARDNALSPKNDSNHPHISSVFSQFVTSDYTHIATPIKADRLTFWLSGYDPIERRYLSDGFNSGFSIHYSGIPISSIHENHPSASNDPNTLCSLIDAELTAKRVAGPFPSPPFHPFKVSPLGLVPKKDTGKFRLIHDLSYPKYNSVNSAIAPENAAVAYETFDTVVDLVQRMGNGALIAKVDIENAFRIIPINPNDRYLLGFMFNGKYYFDKCLPMGCRSSCAIFERFSSALQWIAIHKLSIPGISHILDDFIFVGPPNSPITALALDTFLLLCKDCNVPIKASKTVPPSTCVTAHGIEIDTLAMEARLPADKLFKARQLLIQFANQRRVTLRELQSCIGFLNFACRVVSPGRAFLRRLINLSMSVTQPHHFVTLNRESRADIRAWLVFLESYNGITMFSDTFVSDSNSLKLFSDASGSLGFAAVFGAKWFYGSWPSSFHDTHITTKELFPITLMSEIWGPYFQNKRILFHTDNSAVAEIINKQSCKDPQTMSLVRRFVLSCLQFNVNFRACHIPGATNVIPDKLSRFQFQEARDIAPWLDASPTPIPDRLMCLTWKTSLAN